MHPPGPAGDGHRAGDRGFVNAPAQTVLDAREARWRRRLELARSIEGEGALISLTLRMPVRFRTSGEYEGKARIMFETLAASLAAAGGEPALGEFRIGADGPEGFLVTPLPPRRAKELALGFEDGEAWGALVDVDVMDASGRALSRRDLGLPPRRCLLCGGDAASCVLARSHGEDELKARIDELFSLPAPRFS